MADNLTIRTAGGTATVDTIETSSVHRPVHVLGAGTRGGTDTFRTLDLDETAEQVKATPGTLYGYFFANLSSSWRYLKFYDATGAGTTVGTTTPKLTYPLPPSSAGHINLAVPIDFDTAITAAATTGLADNDTGAPGANEVVLNVSYK